MENEKLEELSLEVTTKANDMLKKSKKLKKDLEKFLNEVEETNKKNKTETKRTRK